MAAEIRVRPLGGDVAAGRRGGADQRKTWDTAGRVPVYERAEAAGDVGSSPPPASEQRRAPVVRWPNHSEDINSGAPGWSVRIVGAGVALGSLAIDPVGERGLGACWYCRPFTPATSLIAAHPDAGEH